MAAIIKRQILKHLSRFTKNLSPEQINLSTLRGEGHLTDLQLDEEALQNMLDLPTWLAVTRVYCNRAAIRVLSMCQIDCGKSRSRSELIDFSTEGFIGVISNADVCAQVSAVLHSWQCHVWCRVSL
ncbi:UHRF1-binding protein 1-like [Bufo bufo]|uniref:UHRF1-binding protein 1-like n=1 Tax=Bufo bufo TaxID=8384 RepID=UPI001ABDC27F|nr:UHRF1-binding protein 1-like [Bufo bufo]